VLPGDLVRDIGALRSGFGCFGGLGSYVGFVGSKFLMLLVRWVHLLPSFQVGLLLLLAPWWLPWLTVVYMQEKKS
jgi:hypothetical protein